jgi:Arc/MetJ family transcription regulator
MRTTLNIDDQLLDEAERITGLTEKAALVRGAARADRARERPAAGAVGRQ